LLYYRFRFSSAITRVDRIQVKMTAGKIGDKDVDGWTTVYQRVKPDDGSPDDWPGSYPQWKPGISTGIFHSANTALLSAGEIALGYEVAKQGGKHENGINEVRMDGVFINKSTPLGILTDIMEKYAYVPFDNLRYYNMSYPILGLTINETLLELSALSNYEIGVMFDKSVTVYEVQFQVFENKFTVRLDDPERPESMVISHLEILNLNEVEIDYNADLYGTYTDIEYAYNYDEKSGKRWIDKEKRQEIFDKHRQDKDWRAKTPLANKTDAKKKSDILLEDFSALAPLIKNIQLSGKKWFDLETWG